MPDGGPLSTGSQGADRSGEAADSGSRSPAFLLIRGQGDSRAIVVLDQVRAPLTIGRRSGLDVSLSWDTEVSRLHAELVPVGGDWTLVDDGLSTNGSFVNGERLHGRRRLQDGDALRFGATTALFRRSDATHTPPTTPGAAASASLRVSDTQRRILVALCRPFRRAQAFATPATNERIAHEVHLSVDAVKKHLRVLFVRFGVGDLPQNVKRVRLAERALATGVIAQAEL